MSYQFEPAKKKDCAAVAGFINMASDGVVEYMFHDLVPGAHAAAHRNIDELGTDCPGCEFIGVIDFDQGDTNRVIYAAHPSCVLAVDHIDQGR